MSLANCKAQIAWAKKVLAAPAVTYPNGRNSHDAAGEVLEQYEDEIIDYTAIQLQANGEWGLTYVDPEA